ncbi:hypothetical protein GCM10020331_001880 [Ectobacillus funiculus]
MECVSKFVYMFDEGNGGMKELLGGKGANLAEMIRIGLPVPYGFTISTEACNSYYDAGKSIPAEIQSQILDALHRLEEKNRKKRLGDPTDPLLVSVRSGAVFFDAGNDGHSLKSWNERRNRERNGRAYKQSAFLPMTLTVDLFKCLVMLSLV